MAYINLSLSETIRKFDLKIIETEDIFTDIAEVPPRPEFASRLTGSLPLALLTSTEKARSEFIIAPIFVELWMLQDKKIGIHAGLDDQQGLMGLCDYIVTRSPEQLFIIAPITMLVKSKNDDVKRGVAQCIAEMVTAQTFNAREGLENNLVTGVVTTGELWRFITLVGKTVHIDVRSYHISELAKITGILLHLTDNLEPVQ